MIRSCLTLLAALSAFAALASHAATPAKPNVLFILVDDMGYGDAACDGGVGIPTPNIDRLAAEGLRATNFYVASPICSPSRVAFTTGMFPSNWGITSYLRAREGNRADDQPDWLDPKAPSLARALQTAGYATGHFGKWHMGGGRDVNDAPKPAAYGFDESIVNSTPIEGLGPHLPLGTPRWKTTGLFIDATLDFIKRQKAAGKPFYVNLWFSEVHDKHCPRPEDADPELMNSIDMYKEFPDYPQTMKTFQLTLKGFDRDMGRLLEGLKALGVDENTLIVFSGDNGPNPLYDREARTRTAGLRGQKWSLYEGGTHEPFIVRWPGKIPAGKIDSNSVLSSVDLFPTICSLLGVSASTGAKFDGEDASAAWLGKPWERTKPLMWDYGRTATFIKPPLATDRSPNLAIRDGQWKLLINADGGGAELYDLSTDAKETKNRALEKPDVTERLSKIVLTWRKSFPAQ